MIEQAREKEQEMLNRIADAEMARRLREEEEAKREEEEMLAQERFEVDANTAVFSHKCLQFKRQAVNKKKCGNLSKHSMKTEKMFRFSGRRNICENRLDSKQMTFVTSYRKFDSIHQRLCFAPFPVLTFFVRMNKSKFFILCLKIRIAPLLYF